MKRLHHTRKKRQLPFSVCVSCNAQAIGALTSSQGQLENSHRPTKTAPGLFSKQSKGHHTQFLHCGMTQVISGTDR